MSAAIVVEARRERDDMISAAWLEFWRSRVWLWFPLVALVVGLLAPGNFANRAIAAAALTALPLTMFTAALVLNRAERGAKAAAKLDPVTHRFSLERLDVEAPGFGAASLPWSTFERALDNDRVLVLQRTSNLPLVIPKRQIGANWPRLKELLSVVLNERVVFKREQAA